MANLRLCRVPSDKLSALEQLDGQLIFLEDRPGCFYDVGDDRIDLSFGATGEILWQLDSVENIGEESIHIDKLEMENHVCPFNHLELVFLDTQTPCQFSAKMWGRFEGGGYTYADCCGFRASYIENDSYTQQGKNNENCIRVNIDSIFGGIEPDGTLLISFSSFLNIQANNDELTMSLTDDNVGNIGEAYVGLYQVRGWR